MSDEEFVSRGRYKARLKASPVTAQKPYKPVKAIDERNIEICLTCDAPKCKGYCDKIKRRTNDGRTSS